MTGQPVILYITVFGVLPGSVVAPYAIHLVVLARHMTRNRIIAVKLEKRQRRMRPGARQ